MMKINVIEGQQFPLSLEGQYIYMRDGRGDVDFYRETVGERFTLNRTAVYRVKVGEIGRLIVTPRFSGELEILTGWGDFNPPSDDKNITVQRIIEPIQFEATVNVNDGQKVEVIASSRLNSIADKMLASGEKLRVTSNSQGREKTMIQVLSDEITLLRVGSVDISQNVGAVLVGSVLMPASMVVDSSAAVWVLNTSEKTAKISVTEVLR
ncbi:hypothetical protein M3912_002824 [Vibrio metschnikovii]|nr:hypothetical protein [Vibrio metschnikovii]